MNHSTRNCIHLLIVVAFMVMAAANPVLTFAMPRDPIDPDPVGGDEPYTAPDNGFDWRVPARFGLYENGMVDFHWIEDQAIYEADYVNPTEFPVIFDGCRTADDEESGTSQQMTYTWVIDGQTMTAYYHTCRFLHTFASQGTYPVSLTITNNADNSVLLDEQGRGNPFQQEIVVRDILIVSIGDSYASGEGNPDRWQKLGGSDAFGQPTHVESQSVWQDARCHRSGYSAPAQAARMLEFADPHTSVTFLSFACSGATIDTHIYKDASWFDPYRSPDVYGYVQDEGTGILGPASGAEPPNPNRPQDNWMPSQISQTLTALTNNALLPPRPVDALIISAGGNDMGFGNIAQLCALYWNCDDILVEHYTGDGLQTLRDRVTNDIRTLPGLYAALAQKIQDNIPFTENGRVYITQYPDLTRNGQGNFCDEMLQDVVPWWLDAYLAADAVIQGAPYVPLPPFRMDNDEASWAGGVVAPQLNSAVADAAQAHDWILVDGINDSTANLFATHGYCASDNWIRTATEAVDIQGPWVPWHTTLLPPASMQTRGTLHPTAEGHLAIAERIMARMRPILLPLPPGQEPPAPPTFSSSSNNAIVSASGWLTGHETGMPCPGGAADCTFAQVVATSATNTDISGASLLLNGAPIACPATGATVGGLTCQAQLTTPQTYNWSLAFANDGIYQLGFSASSNNGANATFNREVKVDLTDPTASHEVSSAADASGWYRIPVTVTVTAADGAGSGPANIEYELDGDAFVVGGNSGVIDVYDNGLHALKYRTTDTAGRMSAWQTLGLRIDQTAPVSVVSVSPAANNNGWHSTSSVEVTLSATDSGGSGLAGLTYSAAGAQPIASTTVDDDDTVSLSITEEGETTISFFAADFAGNVEVANTVTVRLDRTAQVQGTIYVDVDATGANDGSSWENAYTTLQSALDDAMAGDQIWVAAGTYKPTYEFDPGDPRSATFQLKNGVAVYGGFDSSVGDTDWDDRDWMANVTILSGDLGIPGAQTDNSYHVFYHPAELSLDVTAVLDGFVITGGYAHTSGHLRGGGMYNEASSPTVTNCTFVGNRAATGGGMANYDSSSPTVTNCTFSENEAAIGAGMANYNSSSPTVTHSSFLDNDSDPGNGGGMFNDHSSPTVSSCIFAGNTATSGGGIYNYTGSSPIVTNCAFVGNSATSNGGGMKNYTATAPVVTNCTFLGNSAKYYGGGIYNGYSNLTMTNCILWEDTPDEIDYDGPAPVVNYSDIQGGYAGTGNINADPTFEDPGTGDFDLLAGSPCIDAGTNAANLPPYDFEGDPRIWDGDSDGTATADMGADEFAFHTLTLQVTGTGSGSVEQTPEGARLEHGTVVTLMAIANTGSWFTEWTGDAVGTGNPKALNMDMDKVVTATFTLASDMLTITQIADHETVSTGDPVGFTITITNNGDDTARSVTLADPLPTAAELSWSVGGTDAASCTITAGIVSCNFGDMPPGAVKTIRLTSPTQYLGGTGFCPTIISTATVMASNQPEGRSATASTQALCPRVYISVWADTPSVVAGDPVSYTVTVGNVGEGIARDVIAETWLPENPGLSWSISNVVPASAAGNCGFSSGPDPDLICGFPELAPGEEVTITVTSPTTSGSSGTLESAGGVTISNGGAIRARTAIITVNGPALLITKTADEGPFSAGDQIGFTIEVSNPYPVPVYGVTLTDTVPTIPMEWLIDQEVSPECSLGSGVWTCNVGTMAPNTTYSVHIFTSSSSSTCGRVVENSASVSYSSGSPSSASDSLVVNCPDLTVTNTAASETVSTGDPVSFDITVTNHGAGTAKDVALSDTLPTYTELSWSVGGTDAASCTITAGIVSCNFGDMPPGAVKTIRLTSPTHYLGGTGFCPTISSVATLSAYNQPEGRSATASTEVLCPHAYIMIGSDTWSVTAGDPISYMVIVGNAGMGIARHVDSKAELPNNTGLSWSITNVTPASAAGNCTIDNSATYPALLVCLFDELAAGQEVTITVSSPTTSGSCGTLVSDQVGALPSNGPGAKGKNADIIVSCTVGETVQPGEAATLKLPDGRGQIEFPANLVTVPTTFTYTEQDAPSQALGSYTFAGLSFTLDATDSVGNPVTSFPASYTIRLTYQDSDWQSAGIAAESLLNLAYWNTATSQWVNVLPCAGCSLDTEQNRLVAVLNHLTEFALLASTDMTQPTTSASLSPEASASGWHAGPVTVTLTASDSDSGVHNTEYNLNGAGWTTYNAPFVVSSESTSSAVHNTVQYRSTDNAGNVEETKSLTIQIDTTASTVGASVPLSGSAVQGGIKFGVNLVDALSGPAGATLSIREADGASGNEIGYENLAAVYNSTSGNWELAQPFDTTQLPDGFYVLVATGKDVVGNEKTEIIPFSVRNWAVLELLPSTENNKAGRTMPVKFSLRVVQEVDPAQPFVYSEELTITIYEAGKPTSVLQSSTFGLGAKDYRINAAQQTYITNFQTLKNPMQYTVEILRDALSIGTFGFQTTK